jgi:hypothetical protein
MYSEQINPLNVERQRLSNEGSGFDNQSKGVKARTDIALEDTDKEAKRQKLLTDASEEHLKRLFAQGEAWSMDPDPKKSEIGNKMREASWKEQQRRAAAEDSLKQTREITGSREKVAGTNADAKKEAAQIAADAKKASVSSQTDYDSLLLKYAKNPTAQAELRITRAQMLAAQGDAAGAQRELTLAQEARQRVAEDISNKGLATPGIDTAAVAELPANMRPAARATVGTVGPVTQGSGNAPPRTAGRGDPPAGSGLVTADEQRDALSVRDKAIADIEAEIKRTQDPRAKAVLQAELDKVKPRVAPAVPTGRVAVVGPDGKKYSLPAGQLEQAIKQGYKKQ